MGAKATKKAKPASDFIAAPELVRLLGRAKTETLGQWVAKGQMPPAWCWLGSSLAWRRDHYEAFKATGRWPAESWKGSAAGQASGASAIQS